MSSEIFKEGTKERKELLNKLSKLTDNMIQALDAELQLGIPTMKDIITEISRLGYDPRDELPKIKFLQGVMTLDDLQVNTWHEGKVSNVCDFGAFIDIGIGRDGLLHISELDKVPGKNIYNTVSVGDIIKVRIVNIDKARKRVSFSMKSESVPNNVKKRKLSNTDNNPTDASKKGNYREHRTNKRPKLENTKKNK